MSETPKCEICGRPFDSTAGNLSEDVCWREVVPPGDGDYWDEDDAHRCYRLGYERARAALSAAEKERDEWRARKETTEAMWKSCTRQVADERDAAEKREARMEAAIRWACGERPLPDGRWFDEREFGYDRNEVPPFWWRSVLRLYSGLTERAALELASAASAAPAAPNESRPLDPPETA